MVSSIVWQLGGLPNEDGDEYIIFPSILTAAAAGCLAAWEMRNRGDNLHTDGTGRNLVGGTAVFNDYGLALQQGANGISTGFTPASSTITIAIAAQIASDASVDGFFVGNVHTGSQSGAGINFSNASPSIRGTVMQAGGSSVFSTAARAKGAWFGAVMAVGATQADMTMDGGSIVSTAPYTTLTTPANPFLLGDGYGSTLGVKGTIGCLAIYNGALGAATRTAVMSAMRTVMATRGVTIPS